MTIDILVYTILENRIYLYAQDEEMRSMRESWVNLFFFVIQVEYIYEYKYAYDNVQVYLWQLTSFLPNWQKYTNVFVYIGWGDEDNARKVE